MPLFFLVTLFTGLITGYFVRKSNDEIAYIAGVFAIVCLVFSLVLAPWQIQLMLLIFVIVSTNKFLSEKD
ncbi:hypothetical protein Cal7507_3853 [Calothrix sp. PCC 7507]|nr:hypothetical protein [Calothrix sp. PCC 7507]AFY34241.1 hypothetical protein Cal7507_3853 [Calothrix sp. PCC 7507]